MAIEYFHISEGDQDMLDQIVLLEQQINARGSLGFFEAHSFIRYGRVYAAVEYDEVLGCVYFMRDFNNPQRVFLYGVIVRPAESGKRLGESLLLSAIADMKESGIRMVEVTVRPDNFKAMRIYREALGFNVINAQNTREAAEEDLLILRKSL